MDSPPQSDLVLCGRYHLTQPVARGGMAELWEARDEVLARPVAVKVLRAALAGDDDVRERFRREAIAAARLVHPGIVSTFDTGEEDGIPFIVMELVRGPDLRRVLLERGEPLSCKDAVAIGVQVADALDHAHRNGVVHRDVKPGNILCDGDRAKVADFGIARAAEGGDLTRAGTMLGTAAYLAPEQVEGGPVDARTDVYALGIVLYELLTGRQPFAGEGDLAVALQRLGGEPLRPRQLRAGVPRPLEHVVLKAMARNPDDRYQSAGELRAALAAIDVEDDDAEPFLDPDRDRDRTPPGGIVPSFRQSERSWLVPAALIVVVAAVLIVVGVLFRSTDVGQSLFDRNQTPSKPSPPASATVASIASVSAFDPDGDGSEHDGDVDAVTDDDPTTAWRTDRYNTPSLGGLKPGVGLVLRLDGPAALHRLVVQSATTGWSAAVYVGDGRATDLAGWGDPVASGAFDGDATFDLHGRRGEAVLLWITRLGAAPGGGFATSVASARVQT